MTYYVYGIIDKTELPMKLNRDLTLADQLSAVIYVGKGTGSRSEAHAAEAKRIIEDEREKQTSGAGASYGRKLDRLIEMFRSGNPPQSVKLSAGFENEADAFAVEAFAIESINALRLAHGRAPLTNKVKGHGVAVEPLPQYISRLNTERVGVLDRHGEGSLAILVKGSTESMGDRSHVHDPQGDLPDSLRGAEGRVASMTEMGELPRRRGWDLHLPWDDDEARARGRRYWPLAADLVRQWIDDPEAAPQYLMLAVEQERQTTVRYVWAIDPGGVWEYYGRDGRGHLWGIPLGEALDDHEMLNTVPTISDHQAMRGNAAGVKLVRI